MSKPPKKAPWLPRMHLFEIHDQPWFHPWFRAKVQAALTETWTMAMPPLQPISPANHVSRILEAELGSTQLSDYVFVDFCAGGGGPTPLIERYLNEGILEDGSWGGSGGGSGSGSGVAQQQQQQQRVVNKSSSNGHSSNASNNISNSTKQRNSAAAATAAAATAAAATAAATTPTSPTSPPPPPNKRTQPVHFVLTDLHPHIPNWARAASLSPNIHYAPQSVDAANAPANLLSTVEPPLPSTSIPPPPPPPAGGPFSSSSSSSNPFAPLSSLAIPPKTFRTFYLAFHHFPDALAARILHNTMTTSAGFAIIELQDRSLASFFAVCLLGLGIMVFSPLFAWRWRSFGTLFWSWVIPVLPFVLVWDGWMSSVRTRTVDEVQHMMRNCGVEPAEVAKWRLRSGRVTHLPPFAEVNWIIATKQE